MEPEKIYYKEVEKIKFCVGKYEDVINHVLIKLSSRKKIILLPCSLNDLASSSKNIKIYKKIDIATTDGAPIAWYLKKKLNKEVDRVYGPDLMKDVLIRTQGKKFKHCLYGSSKKTLKTLEKEIKLFAPKINIKLAISPPYRELTKQEEESYIKTINKNKIDIIWIGMSSPGQVELASKWKRKLPSTSFFCVGAAFDFISGNKISAPKIFKENGLEWFFRLATEPKRLWKRYLVTIPIYLFKKLFQFIFNPRISFF